MSASAAELKACCAAAYATPLARWLLGPSFHPGGDELTERLLRALELGPGDTVVDVACGRGRSVLRAVRLTGCRAVGIDLSAASVGEARREAAAAGLSDAATFLTGDAEALPLGDESVEGVLCECSLCTFPDKPAAAAEMARVLRPGGRLALADVTAEAERLPASLRTLDAWIACVADARPVADLVRLLRDAGLDLELVERHDDALVRLLESVGARLRIARLALASGGDPAPADRGLELVEAARGAVADGALGYAVAVARKPGAHAPATRAAVSASKLV